MIKVLIYCSSVVVEKVHMRNKLTEQPNVAARYTNIPGAHTILEYRIRHVQAALEFVAL